MLNHCSKQDRRKNLQIISNNTTKLFFKNRLLKYQSKFLCIFNLNICQSLIDLFPAQKKLHVCPRRNFISFGIFWSHRYMLLLSVCVNNLTHCKRLLSHWRTLGATLANSRGLINFIRRDVYCNTTVTSKLMHTRWS